MFSTKRALWATTAFTGAMLLASAAAAQSTGSRVVENEDPTTEVTEVVVTASRGVPTFDGLAAAENASRARASVTQEYISTQPAGQTILQAVNILPGVNFTNNDAYGSSGGDIVLRGFDAQRVSLTFDGIPLNDTGNYQIYSNQQTDPELIERANVNLGTTEVDSPTASAVGGTINYVMIRPRRDFGLMLQPSYGSFGYHRLYAQGDTGEFDLGPGRISALFAASTTNYDHFKDFGGVDKEQYNARLYYDMGGGDFASLSFHWNENRNNFTQRVTLAQFNAGTAYNQSTQAFCNRPSVRGTNTEFGPFVGLGGFANTDPSCGGVFRSLINPSNTGNIRGQFSYGLTDTLRVTIDPQFQYTIANGGGTQQFSERDTQLRGNSTAAGVDLNGDGDILDTVALFRPNTTNTRRYGLTSSLIWDPAPEHRLRAAYTYDYGRHRQTGEATRLDVEGDPLDVFGGKDGYGQPINLPDGSIFRRRDRFSIASLNQFSFEYRGDFLDNRLRINAGLRAPFFRRELNQFCFQRDTFNAYCTTQPGFVVPGTNDGTGRPFVVFPGGSASALAGTASGSQVLTGANLTAYRAFFGTTAPNSPFFGQPRRFEKEYDDILPNLGLSYRFGEGHQVFVSYAEGLSAPRTDDLYDRVVPDPQPETTQNFDIGYRYQTRTFSLSTSFFTNNFENRILRTFDEAAGIFLSRNIGAVELMGVDGEIGWRPTEDLTLYASASYIDTEVQGGVAGSGTGAVSLAGRELVETPDWQAALRANYVLRDVNLFGVRFGDFQLGGTFKYVGERFSNDINTEVAPDYTTVDLDVRWDLDSLGWDDSYLQLNVVNLFDEEYLADISTSDTGSAQYQVGAPLTVMLTLRARFF